ncbi:18817_t:CDS:2 [Funneliformis geosporum]|uniref:5197_t:CDS:1 n=1 Tax=Funneliformis geosporum TaxID=1117311 RepID=A0A9W4SIV4_9GLOM|nr:5197_t:CDS:2 [Funneliformis geosporum]CAI2171399.1 18817_t:CDS:2 [Funneliformis geosporum]
MSTITLWCLEYGSSSFYVIIGNYNSIFDLKKAILEEISVPGNVKAKDLRLWKVNFDESNFSNALDELLNKGNEIKLGTQKVGETFHEVQGNNIRVVVKVPVVTGESTNLVNVYTASDSHSVELPSKIIDMLESDKFVPEPRINFETAFQNLKVGQSITLPHLGQEPKHFAEDYQGRILLVTGQMIDIWNKLSADSDHSIKRVLSGPMGVGKSYISYFLASKAYAEKWLMLYIADAAGLNVKTSKRAEKVICRYFLALNKDILTAAELKEIVQHDSSVEVEVAVAEAILHLIKLADHKALLIIDEHDILFEKDPVPLRIHLLSPLMNLNFWGESFNHARVVFTGTAHAKYEIVHMKNGQSNYLIYVGPLQKDVFDKLLQMNTLLNKPGIRKAEKKVTNCVPRELMLLAKYVDSLNFTTINVRLFQQALEKFENERVDQFLVMAQTYYNTLQENEKKPLLSCPYKHVSPQSWVNLSVQGRDYSLPSSMSTCSESPIKNSSGLSLGPGYDKVLCRGFDKYPRFDYILGPIFIQIEMYLNEMYGPSHFAKIDSENRFVVIKNGRRLPIFRIVYIRGSPSTPNHSVNIRKFPDITHITFEEIKSQLIPNII